jgi:hypothetical protein
VVDPPKRRGPGQDGFLSRRSWLNIGAFCLPTSDFGRALDGAGGTGGAEGVSRNWGDYAAFANCGPEPETGSKR